MAGRRRSILVLGLLISCAYPNFSALGSETIAYSYDTQGRLIKVSRSGTINSGVKACYAYDKAVNRSNVTVVTSGDCSGGGGGGGETPPSFAISNASVTEGGNLSFTVTKTGTVSQSYSVNYATANGTAASGSDYTAKSGTLTFAAGDASMNVSVATTDDAVAESAETVLVNLSGATGSATISDSQGVGTINDNEPANQPPVANADSMSVKICETGSKNVTANDTDPNGDTITLTAVTSSAYVEAYVLNGTTVGVTAYGTTGNTQVTYTISDGHGGTDTGVLGVTVLNGTGCM